MTLDPHDLTLEERHTLAHLPPDNEEMRALALAGLRDPNPKFAEFMRLLIILPSDQRGWLMAELKKKENRMLTEQTTNRDDINAHDICSTLHFELNFETGLPAPDRERGFAPSTMRHSDAMYSLVLNRFDGRWHVQLCSVEDVGDDRAHRLIFDARDQPDIAVLKEAFEMLTDREVVNATPS